MEGAVFLADGSAEGILLVLHSGTNTWGTVCTPRNSWGNSVARVACRQMGFYDGLQSERDAAKFRTTRYNPGSDMRPILLDHLECNGKETDVAQCPHSPWGSTDCLSISMQILGHAGDLTIRCLAGAVQIS